MTVVIALAAGVGIVGIVGRSRARPEPPATSPDVVAPAPPVAAKPTLDPLCGPQPASLGPVFAGVEIGRVVDRLPDVPAPPGLDVKIALATTGRRVDSVDITVPLDPGYAECYQFADQLHQRWGHPGETDGGGETWRDAARDRAATFTQGSSDCTLRFFRVVPPEQWLNATRSSRVPIWAIGRPAAELEAALGLPPADDPKTLRWRDQSLGRFRNVELTAHLRRGRVVGITVAPPFDDLVADMLWQRLETLYGTPDIVEGHEESLEVRWRRAPSIRVDKYWGHDALVPHASLVGETTEVVAPTERRPRADDGVLVGITFGSLR
ncbi:MAG TPA: hypothetical protein VMJ10_32310 [Kofleriaceae bacterium]|nr:hypothetical protein [Kofleriaceae bacterium]